MKILKAKGKGVEKEKMHHYANKREGTVGGKERVRGMRIGQGIEYWTEEKAPREG